MSNTNHSREETLDELPVICKVYNYEKVRRPFRIVPRQGEQLCDNDFVWPYLKSKEGPVHSQRAFIVSHEAKEECWCKIELPCEQIHRAKIVAIDVCHVKCGDWLVYIVNPRRNGLFWHLRRMEIDGVPWIRPVQMSPEDGYTAHQRARDYGEDPVEIWCRRVVTTDTPELDSGFKMIRQAHMQHSKLAYRKTQKANAKSGDGVHVGTRANCASRSRRYITTLMSPTSDTGGLHDGIDFGHVVTSPPDTISPSVLIPFVPRPDSSRSGGGERKRTRTA